LNVVVESRKEGGEENPRNAPYRLAKDTRWEATRVGVVIKSTRVGLGEGGSESRSRGGYQHIDRQNYQKSRGGEQT